MTKEEYWQSVLKALPTLKKSKKVAIDVDKLKYLVQTSFLNGKTDEPFQRADEIFKRMDVCWEEFDNLMNQFNKLMHTFSNVFKK